MNINKRILSTKFLAEPQSELLLSTGVSMVHYDILRSSKTDFKLDVEHLMHVIITSSNAIHALQKLELSTISLYIVGEKTAAILKELGFQVEVTAQNSAELSQILINNYKNQHFTYLCGSHRRDELPQALLSTQISFKEVKVYESVVVEKSFDCIFDAVLFFSPRGVHAFAKANPQNIHLAICIGETTATAARTYTENIKVAHKTTVENTIVTAVKALLND